MRCTKIREYAKTVGFEIVGKISYLGKRDLCTRVYTDEAGNLFLLDVVIGGIRIIPRKSNTPDLPGQRGERKHTMTYRELKSLLADKTLPIMGRNQDGEPVLIEEGRNEDGHLYQLSTLSRVLASCRRMKRTSILA